MVILESEDLVEFRTDAVNFVDEMIALEGHLGVSGVPLNKEGFLSPICSLWSYQTCFFFYLNVSSRFCQVWGCRGLE